MTIMLNYFRDRKKKKWFGQICASANLNLDFDPNKAAIPVLEDVFVHRAYADYFPFYERVTIMDIGAHYGYFAIFAARNSDALSSIYAVEPSNSNYKNLQLNLKSCAINNVQTSPIAIGEKVGDFELYEGDSVNHSLLKNYALTLNQQRASIVKVLDLGTFMQINDITTIDFLKMDCEGAEYGIILNAPRDVMDKIKVISMEFHDIQDSSKTANRLREKLVADGFKIVKYEYQRTTMNLNYGKLIAVK